LECRGSTPLSSLRLRARLDAPRESGVEPPHSKEPEGTTWRPVRRPTQYPYRAFGVFALIAVLALASWAAGGRERIASGPLEVAYRPADEEVAQDCLAVLEKGLAEFSSKLPAGDAPIRITICRTLEEFNQMAGAYAGVQVGGIAESRRGAIIVKAPHLLPPGQDYHGMLRHELLHVLIARNTDLANVPRWFNEGIAMVMSRELRWANTMRVAHMYVRRRVIPYPELDFAFAPLGDEMVFGDAYAEAYSMTLHLIDEVGEERFWRVVLALNEMNFDEALKKHAGLTPGALYQGWRRTLWKTALVASLVSGFTLFDVMAILLILAYVRKRRRGRTILRAWDEEEDGENVFSWDKVVESTYPGEEDD